MQTRFFRQLFVSIFQSVKKGSKDHKWSLSFFLFLCIFVIYNLIFALNLKKIIAIEYYFIETLNSIIAVKLYTVIFYRV